MPHPDTNATPPPPPRTPRWRTVALYVALVLFIVAINYLAARNEPPRHVRPATKRTAATERESAASRPNTTTRAPRLKNGNPSSDVAVETRDRQSSPTTKSRPTPQLSTEPSADSPDGLIVRNLRILNENRQVVYRGDVDLRPTLDRIERGKRLRFPNDGSVFENREQRLPAKSSGYYREFVHPTPHDAGPGPQRLVVGREGEVYYTPDHYRTFRRVR